MKTIKDNEKIKIFFDYILELSEFKEEDKDNNFEFIADSTIAADIDVSSFIVYSENLNKMGLAYVAPSFITNNSIDLIDIIKNISKNHNIDVYLELSLADDIMEKYYTLGKPIIENNRILFYINLDNSDNFLNKVNELKAEINNDYFISVIIIINKDFKNIKEFNMELSNISNITFNKKQNILNFIEKIDNKNYETIEKISMLCTI